jgi:uncharacterized membrane protein
MAPEAYNAVSDCEDGEGDSIVRRVNRLVDQQAMLHRSTSSGVAGAEAGWWSPKIGTLLLVLVHAVIIITVNVGGSGQDLVNGLIVFFSVMGTYVVLDLVWVFLVELRILAMLMGPANLQGFRQMKEYGVQEVTLLLLFFVYAAACNFIVIVLPSLDHWQGQYDLRYVGGKAFTMGCFSYVNLSLIMAVQIRNYPIIVFGLTGLSGGALSAASSVVGVIIGRLLLNLPIT